MNNIELDIAKNIINIAKENRYITGPLTISEELADSEKPLLSMIATETRKHVENKIENSLDYEEIASMFLFVYAKAIETVYHWHKGSSYVPLETGLFGGEVPLTVSTAMQQHFQKLTVPTDLFTGFQLWNEANPDYCSIHDTHPIVPIVEALKWTYRISISLAMEYMGYGEN